MQRGIKSILVRWSYVHLSKGSLLSSFRGTCFRHQIRLL